MTETIKFTKNSLRQQEARLKQLELYLPTLKLKKALLQVQISETKVELESTISELAKAKDQVLLFSNLLDETFIKKFAQIKHVSKKYENIAGVEIPVFENVLFNEVFYFLFDSPIWWDSAILKIRELVAVREKMHVIEEKKRVLEKEWHEISIRVNLFEKVLIPTALVNIKKIRIFLGDQELAAVAQAKIAKAKILRGKEDDREG